MNKSIPQIFEEIQEAFDKLFTPDIIKDRNNEDLIKGILKHEHKQG